MRPKEIHAPEDEAQAQERAMRMLAKFFASKACKANVTCLPYAHCAMHSMSPCAAPGCGLSYLVPYMTTSLRTVSIPLGMGDSDMGQVGNPYPYFFAGKRRLALHISDLHIAWQVCVPSILPINGKA